MARMPTGRSHLSLASLNSKGIVASGGIDGQKALKTVQLFMHSLQNWVEIASMNEARSCHASTGFKGNAVIVFMGLGEDNQDTNTIERWQEGQTDWRYLHITGAAHLLKPTNCLRAAEYKFGEIILWSKFLDQDAVFQFIEESDGELKVKRIYQKEGVPNCDHASGVNLIYPTLYAYDQYDEQLWGYQNEQWTRRYLIFLQPKEFGI